VNSNDVIGTASRTATRRSTSWKLGRGCRSIEITQTIPSSHHIAIGVFPLLITFFSL